MRSAMNLHTHFPISLYVTYHCLSHSFFHKKAYLWSNRSCTKSSFIDHDTYMLLQRIGPIGILTPTTWEMRERGKGVHSVQIMWIDFYPAHYNLPCLIRYPFLFFYYLSFFSFLLTKRKKSFTSSIFRILYMVWEEERRKVSKAKQIPWNQETPFPSSRIQEPVHSLLSHPNSICYERRYYSFSCMFAYLCMPIYALLRADKREKNNNNLRASGHKRALQCVGDFYIMHVEASMTHIHIHIYIFLLKLISGKSPRTATACRARKSAVDPVEQLLFTYGMMILRRICASSHRWLDHLSLFLLLSFSKLSCSILSSFLLYIYDGDAR